MNAGDVALSDVFNFHSVLDAEETDSMYQVFERGRLTRLRARGIPSWPAPMLPEEGFEYWAETLRERVRKKYDAVVLITGPVGSSKSTLALRLAQELQPNFNLNTSLCYTAAALMGAYENVKPGDVVLFDEGVRGLLAGDQMTREQKSLVQALALVREKGAILIICAPSIFLIAKQVRQGRATMWIQVLGRGIGLVHERNDRLRYVPDQTLGFSRSAYCPYLRWAKYADNSRFWMAYQAEKLKRLDEFLADTKALLEGGKSRGAHGGAKTGESRKEYEARRKREWRQGRKSSVISNTDNTPASASEVNDARA
jgi:hypothetical protein